MISNLPVYVAYFKARMNVDDTGATAVEYGLMIALIAIVVAVGAAALGGSVNGLFKSAANTVSSQTPATPVTVIP